MIRMTNPRFALLLIAMMAGAAIASAQDFTFYLGFDNPGDLKEGAVTRKLESGATYGFRVSTSLAPFLGLEHTIGFGSNFLRPKDGDSFDNVKGFIYNSNLIVNIPVGNAVPYFTAGIGLVRQYGSPNLPVGTRFATNYGGGLKLRRLAGPMGLRFDARAYTTSAVTSHRLNIFELTAGALFSW